MGFLNDTSVEKNMDGPKIITPGRYDAVIASMSNEKIINLKNILESSSEGQFLLNLNQRLNERQQKMLVDLIVVYIINQKRKISV